MKNQLLTLRYENYHFNINLENNSKPNVEHFLKWVKTYALNKFISENTILVTSHSKLRACRLKALKLDLNCELIQIF